MIPASFEYHAPTTIEEALRLLRESGDDVKVLAGGQSLLPVLKLRLAAPEVVVDLGRVQGLAGIREDGDTDPLIRSVGLAPAIADDLSTTLTRTAGAVAAWGNYWTDSHPVVEPDDADETDADHADGDDK